MSGYTQRVLNVDLANGNVQVEAIDAAIVRDFIGGIGYGSKIVHDEVPSGVDPLGPDNVIVYSTGPLTGCAPFSGRLDVSTKSPVNGLITMSNVGGQLAVELKRAGYDVLVVRKCSSEPVYIWIDDDRVEIRRADAVWGRDAWDTADALRSALGERHEQEIKVAAIGPGGENRVRFASLNSQYFHAAGRGGTGAVMGSKNLKAIAVRGTKEIPVAKPQALQRASREVLDRIMNSWNPVDKSGVRDRWTFDGFFINKQIYEDGTLAVKNRQTTRLPGWLEHNTMEQAREFTIKPLPTCHRCPFPCYSEVQINEGKYAGLRVGGIYFASCAQYFGGLCGILGLPAVWKCKEVCQRLGMDYWSAGNVVAFAMELYQRGIVTATDTGGIPLNWGDEDAVIQMLEQIAFRRGLGDILAEGSAIAAERIGKDAKKYAFTIKGDEMQFVDPRVGAIPGKGKFRLFGMLDSPRGGENIKTTHGYLDRAPAPEVIREQFGMSPDEYVGKYAQYLDIFEEDKKRIFGVPARLDADSWEGRAAFAKWSGDLCSTLSSLGMCIFPWTRGGAIGPTHLAKMLSACTGVELTPAELMKAGERVFNLQRMYLVSCGFDGTDDDFPAKFYDEAIPDGPAKGTRLSKKEIDEAKQEYYLLRGWDETGVPSREKLHDLGLAD